MKPEDFEAEVKRQQNIQKRNPYGSKAHRKAFERIRKMVKENKGIDIGSYE